MSNELRSQKHYGALALLPLVVFLVIYVGVGLYFTAIGAKDAFDKLPRHVAILIAIAIAWLAYDRRTPLHKKVKIFTENAGSSGIAELGLILLLAGAFASAASASGGQDALVNMGLSIIPPSLLIPGIFAMSAFVATAMGTSTGTQAAFLPIGVAVAQSADLNVAAAAAAVIAGAYFGDNLSIISDTTIAATTGVGANMKDKFRANFLIALPAAIITFIIYAIVGGTGKVKGDLSYNIIDVIPYLFVLIAAIAGMNVMLVLLSGIVMTGILGMIQGKIQFFEWTSKVGEGMESTFSIFLVAFLISGLVALIRYYGGIDWIVETMKKQASGRKSAEYSMGILSGVLSAALVNNVVAILIAAPIAKEIGETARIAPKRMASILDIFAACALMVLPHDSGMLMAEQFGHVSYIEVLQFSFYPVILILCTVISIHLGMFKTKKAS
ncbi:Na+/H+ antiporter NhaC family protein [Staphylococcus chromogenes]|uniref:Na+/H+ antiporter NhaC family protein n=1 Tax=Staphylococcus chromogenes TaxID=46126 RepID=UPI002884CBE0|nr:Na+/H+ antiporter NhaC family protein [Staphylococcus chromogenes]MDT0740947.1 Na+/H+ antiporter NhaC family protein [Staphylococcus chromogenes]